MRELDKDVALVGVDLLLKQVGEAAACMGRSST